MIVKFVKDSIRELKHVVWPSRDDTRKYFLIVLSFIIIFWIYLFVASNLFWELILALKKTV